MKYVAYMTKGLEGVAKDEILHKIYAEIVAVDDKRIVFETEIDIETLVKLLTIDDLGVFVGQATGVKDISQLEKVFDEINFESVRKQIKEYRKLMNTFSLTITAAGSRLSSKEIIEVVKRKITEKYQWQFTEFDHTNFDTRIFIDHEELIISVRLIKESLHHRWYKTISKSGSLKPTIAAAMVQLATNFQNNLKLVDNFCGSGTILCESVLSGNEVYGGDIDSESVMITKTNLKNLHHLAEGKVKVLDSTKPTWQSNFFDCAISNLPWDKQIEIKSITSLYERAIKEFARILKPNGKVCVLLSKPELFIKYAKKYFPNRTIQQIKLGFLGQNPTIVIVG